MATTEVDIVNLALSHLGHTDFITAVGGGTVAELTGASTSKKEALAQQFYEIDRKAVLKEQSWRFARVYALLVEVDNGDGEVWRDEWDRAFTIPDDCLYVRQLLPNDELVNPAAYGIRQDRFPAGTWRYAIRVHAGVKVLMANVSATDARLEYTENVTSVARMADEPHFLEALTRRLAWHMAPAISTDRGLPNVLLGEYKLALAEAKLLDINQDNPPSSSRRVSKYIHARY